MECKIVSAVGRITLWYDDSIIDSVIYDCRGDRTRIINRWQLLYGPRYLKCALIISPNTKNSI